MKGLQTYKFQLSKFHKFREIFLYDFETFVERLNFLSRNLWKLSQLKFTTQITSTDKHR